MPASNKTTTTTNKTPRKPRQPKAATNPGLFITSEQLELFLNAQRESFAAAVAESHMQLKVLIEQNHLSMSHDFIGLTTHMKTLEDRIMSIGRNPIFGNTPKFPPNPIFGAPAFVPPSFPMYGNAQFGVNYMSLKYAISLQDMFPAFIPYVKDTSPSGLVIDIGGAFHDTMTGLDLVEKLDKTIQQSDIYKTIYLAGETPDKHTPLTSIEQFKEWGRKRHQEFLNQRYNGGNGTFTVGGLILMVKSLKQDVAMLNFDMQFKRVNATTLNLVFKAATPGFISPAVMVGKISAAFRDLASMSMTPLNENMLVHLQGFENGFVSKVYDLASFEAWVKANSDTYNAKYGIKQTEQYKETDFYPFSLMGILSEFKNCKDAITRIRDFDFSFIRLDAAEGRCMGIGLEYKKRLDGFLTLKEFGTKFETKLQESEKVLQLDDSDKSFKPLYVIPGKKGPVYMPHSAMMLLNWLDCQ